MCRPGDLAEQVYSEHIPGSAQSTAVRTAVVMQAGCLAASV